MIVVRTKGSVTEYYYGHGEWTDVIEEARVFVNNGYKSVLKRWRVAGWKTDAWVLW